MTPGAWAFTGVLAALLAASTLVSAPGGGAPDALALGAEGIGPLELGQDYFDAVAATRRAAPQTAFAGLGCNGLDEIRYSGEFAALPVSVMGMARDGMLAEIELTVDAPVQTADESACLALRDHLAVPFLERFGPAGIARIDEKPVSREHILPVGPVALVARWFASGRSCYVSAVYAADL
jgi:hypothetical protein